MPSSAPSPASAQGKREPPPARWASRVGEEGGLPGVCRRDGEPRSPCCRRSARAGLPLRGCWGCSLQGTGARLGELEGGRLLAGWRGWDAVRAADDFRHIEAWVAGVRHPSLPTRTPRRPQPSCSSLALPVATVTLQAGAGKRKKKKKTPKFRIFG